MATMRLFAGLRGTLALLHVPGMFFPKRHHHYVGRGCSTCPGTGGSAGVDFSSLSPLLFSSQCNTFHRSFIDEARHARHAVQIHVHPFMILFGV